eukprot:COSAG02_NODE_3154_length_7266_cov_5.826287_7_plen_98_part_00
MPGLPHRVNAVDEAIRLRLHKLTVDEVRHGPAVPSHSGKAGHPAALHHASSRTAPGEICLHHTRSGQSKPQHASAACRAKHMVCAVCSLHVRCASRV